MKVRNSGKRFLAGLLALLLLVTSAPHVALTTDAEGWDWYWSLDSGSNWTNSTDDGDSVWTAAVDSSYMQYTGMLGTVGSVKGEFCNTVAGVGAQYTSITLVTGNKWIRIAYYRPLHQIEVAYGEGGGSGTAQVWQDWDDANAIPVGQWYTMEVKWNETTLSVYLDGKQAVSYEYTGMAINDTTLCQVTQNGLRPSVKNLSVSLEPSPSAWDSSAWTGTGWTSGTDSDGTVILAPSGDISDTLSHTLYYGGFMGTSGSVQADFLVQNRPDSTENPNAYFGFLLRNPDGSNLSFQYQTCYEQLVFKQSNVTQNWIQQPKTLPLNQWVTFGIQWDTEKVYLYINGELRFSQAYSGFTVDANTVCEIEHWGTYPKVKNVVVDVDTTGSDPILWTPKDANSNTGGWTSSTEGDTTVYTATQYISSLHYTQALGPSGSAVATVLCGKDPENAAMGNAGLVLTTTSGKKYFAYYRVGTNTVYLQYDGVLVDCKELSYPVGLDNWFTLELKWEAGTVYVYMDGKHILSHRGNVSEICFDSTSTVYFSHWEHFPKVKNLAVTLGDHIGTAWSAPSWTGSQWYETFEMNTSVLTTDNASGTPSYLSYTGSMQDVNSIEYDLRYNKLLWPDGNIGLEIYTQEGSRYTACWQSNNNVVNLYRDGAPVEGLILDDKLAASQWNHFQVVWDSKYIAVFVNGVQVVAYDYTVHNETFGPASTVSFSEWGHPASVKNVKVGQSSVIINNPNSNRVRLSSLFGDNMLLQRNKKVKIFGYGGEAGDTVRVSFAGQVKTTTSNGETWELYLDPMEASAVGRPLTVEFIKAGEQEPLQTITLNDVVVGELWLCSGQSNMHYTVGELVQENSREALADYYAIENLDKLRFFTAPVYYSDIPMTYGSAYGVKWKTPTTDTIDGLSAVALGFAAQLQASLGEDVPVGVLSAALKGSFIEEWLDTETLSDLGSTYTSINSRLYNGMIHNMAGVSIGGILWYQGEANAFAGGLYRDQMAAYAQMYRELFEDENIPIIWFQLPQFREQFWPHFRQTQWELMDEIPNTYAVCGIDLGVKNNVHPTDKYEFSGRAVGVALQYIYDLEPDEVAESQRQYGLSPYVKELEWTANSIVVHLNDATTLTPGADGISGFEGFNGVSWVALNAKIQGNTIVLTGDVANTTKVRYLQSAFFYGDIFIYNEYGLPVAPFSAMGVEGIPDEPGVVTGSTTTLTFESAADLEKLALYNSDEGVFRLNDGKLVADANGELKAMFTGNQNAQEMDISVNISLTNPNSALNAGVYVLGGGAGDAQDQVDGYNIQLESSKNSRDLVVNLHYFTSFNGFEQKITGVCLYGYFENGSAKPAVTLRAVVKDNRLDVYIDGILLWQGIDVTAFTVGSVGLRSQVCGVAFDDMCIVMPAVQSNDGFVAGDVDGNGMVDSADARAVLQYVVGLETLTDGERKAADVNGDGAVNSTDARLILQKSVGITP